MDHDVSGAPTLNRRRLIRSAAVAAGAFSSLGVQRIGAEPAPSARLRTARRSQVRKVRFALTTDDQPRVQPLLDQYASETGIIVEPQAFPYPDLYEDLNINLTLGTCAYDVVSLDDPWMPLFAGQQFLTNLKELATREGVSFDREDFVPAFIALGTDPTAGLQAIPWIGNVQVYAWRQDVMQELRRDRPRTWDDVIAAATDVQAARPGGDLYGVGIRGQTGNSAATTFLPILRGHGADVFDAGWVPQLESEQAQAAMGTLLALAKLAPPGVEEIGHEELAQELYTGRIAQAADIWPNQMLQVYDPARSTVLGKVAIGAQPAQPGVQPASMTGNWLLGIPAGCGANAREALAFALWLTAPEQQKRLLLERGLPPTRLSVFADPESVEKLPFLPGLVEAGMNAAPRPRTLHYPAVEEILGRWVAQAISGRVSGEEALGQANQEIRGLMVREGVLRE